MKKNDSLGIVIALYWLFIGWWVYLIFKIPYKIFKALFSTKKKMSEDPAVYAEVVRPVPSSSPMPAEEELPPLDFEQSSNNVAEDSKKPVEIKMRTFISLRHPDPLPVVVTPEEFNSTLNSIPLIVPQPQKKVKRHSLEYLRELKASNITRRTNLQSIFPLVVIDVETTGLSPEKDEIIEVSAIKYDDFRSPVSAFASLVKPKATIPEEITRITGIDNEMVDNAPSFASIAQELSEYISGCNILGHNVSFDIRFIYAGGVELPEKLKIYDTLDIAKKYLYVKGQKFYDPGVKRYIVAENYDVEDLKLGTLCRYYGIQPSASHRSLSDCLATILLFEKEIEDKTDQSQK